MRTGLFIFSILMPTWTMANPSTQQSALKQHMEAEANYRPHYADSIKPKVQYVDIVERVAWPFPILSIGHTIASYQNYGGSPYFHHGLDIRADAGTKVYTPLAGKVVNIENYVPGNPAYWEVAIEDDNGYVWQYHHVDRGSIPAEIHEAYRSGRRIEAGTEIGEIYYWSVVTFGERFHHIHLNILGEGGRYLNGFNFLEELADDAAPQITAIGLLQNGRRVRGNQVSGRYSLYVEAKDLILHDKFFVPPYEIVFSVNGGVEQTLWRFDELPGLDNNRGYVHDFFVSSDTCGNYSCRRFLIDAGFAKPQDRSFPQTRGSHSITVTARDYAGNSVTETFDWTVAGEER